MPHVDDIFRIANEDRNEWIPPRLAAAAIREAVAAERIRIASLLEHSADCMDEGATRCTKEPHSVSLRQLAAAIRAG